MAHEPFMQQALALARESIATGGRPFAAVLVHQGRVIAQAVNQIHLTQDPTAHAELQAIRLASQAARTGSVLPAARSRRSRPAGSRK